ncbi:putative efflux protein, MATE family [Halobacteroides halobius DSM 5150]|uniref:Putative efflux protein, MATE family n=1 Tax=Halobacteroides halobius (strain ATCC 35273 / DSM 5150 / MD-1) TaxID=748449 RepID=L0K8J0_HALHC|nr:MATE family efflux transporter [Halobacteroides halobius]AGB41311.1 putative efflux protein, MATE family [Halobacteroides halobius DSM 5150]
MELNKKSDRLGTEPILPLLFKLAAPGIVGMIINALYNVVDSIYIGRLSTEALSALALAFPIQMILIAIGAGTGIGTNSLISRLLGKGEVHKANNTAEHVFLIAIIYSIVTGIIGGFFGDDLINLFTNNPHLIALGNRYIRIIMMGSVAVFVPIIFNNILRGEGNTFVPMLTMLIGAITNIILDPFLIFGLGFFPKLGVEGAAVATVVSRALSGLFITLVILSDKNQIQLKLEEFDFDLQIIKEIYQVGFPAMIMRGLASIMIAGMNTIVGAYSTTAIAIVGIYFRLQAFVILPILGLSQGFMPLVGYNYGHNNPNRMKKTIISGSAVTFLFSLVSFATFQLFADELIRLFNNDPKLITIGTTALKRISLAYLIMGVNLIGSTTFQAIGKGFPSLFISFLRQILILLPTMYFLGEIYGLSTLWFAFPIAEGITFIILSIWLITTLKKLFIDMKTPNLINNH